MANKVVIVESNAKAKTISKYLGKGYAVKASRGHIRDLPPDRFSVDVENDFEPTYQVMQNSRRIVGQLKKLAKDAEMVYLAPDPDREGEAIAWHLQHVLDLPEERVARVTFNEITRTAVREAFAEPRRIDRHLVDAQQARRILDRIVGYQLSPLISSKVLRGLSAGRVQSVALRIIVDRERERDAFEPEEFWELAARLHGEDPAAAFEAMLTKLDGKKAHVATGEQAEALAADLRAQDYAVESVKKRATGSKAPPPFITSTLQQAAHSALHFSASQTMRIAQQLYEGLETEAETTGLITYMRTDSTRVAAQALAACRELIVESYGEAYLPAKPHTFRSPRGAQAAHEAIRPTNVKRTPALLRSFLDDRQYKLYDLIWRRFVASQMNPARYDVTTVLIAAGRAQFLAKGRVMTFDGHTRVSARQDAKDKDQMLPPLAEGDPLTLAELTPSQHFTQPPPRYSEASLVRELEKQGIGRPSTYAPTIRTLLNRNYVRTERRVLRPTDLGIVVTDLLVEHFPREMDLSFTSRLEDELDEIEDGKRNWREILAEFYEQFSGDLERAKDNMQTVRQSEPDEPVLCEKCGAPMVIQFSRKGDKFLGCSSFPECKNTMPLARPDEEGPVLTDVACPKCGAPMARRTGRRGREYLACSAYPACRNIMGLDKEGRPVPLEPRVRTGMACPRCGEPLHLQGKEENPTELTCARCRFKVPLLTVAEAIEKTELEQDEPLAVCEECQRPMAVKRSRKGMFLGCTGYPECKATMPMPKDRFPAPQPTFERCEKCGRPLIMRWGQFGRFLACSGFPGCRNLWQITGRRHRCKADGCGARLMKKIAQDGTAYLGCTRWPRCDYTEPLPEPAAKEKTAAKKTTRKKTTRKKAVKKRALKKKATKKKTSA